ncbi:MAG TPA: hypothetical protein VFJ16_07525 [Longimicrobium sp.]|nr:hypothetical protein [Longimicrobium sp.]
MFSIRRTTFALAAVAALTAGTAAAQTATPTPEPVAGPVAKNTFYVELLGNAAVYSLNYERFFTPQLGIRVGGMFLRGEDDSGDEATIGIFPVMATYLLGEGNSHFETGLGVGILTASANIDEIDEDFSGSDLYATATLGYRYQKPTGGVIFRAGFTPAYASGTFIPWVGASVGYAF